MAYNKEFGVNGNSNMDHDVADLEREKEVLSSSSSSCQNALKLLSEEIDRRQGKQASRDIPKYSDLVKNKPTRVAVKVVIPTKEHPQFNFVGKLLGPKGSSLKRLQEETMTKMSVKGEGSMRDKKKEDELRSGGEQKYMHLNEELHVEITTMAPVAEAYARIAHALAEIQKYLIPDSNDTISHEQHHMFEMMGSSRPSRGGPGRGAPRGFRGAGRALLSTPSSTSRPGMSVGRGSGRPMGGGQREYGKHSQSMEDPYSIYDSYSPYESYAEAYEAPRERTYDSYGTYTPDPSRYRSGGADNKEGAGFKFPLSDRSRFRSVPY